MAWSAVEAKALVEDGHTLPADWYYDPAIFALERERIFGRVWQFAGVTAGLQEPGAYRTTSLAGRRVLLVRGADGVLRAFHNVCPHRANALLEGSGQVRMIQCRYHCWTFDLDGRLRNAPGMKDDAGFRPDLYGLRPIRAETWGPFVFVNLDPDAPPLADYVSPELRGHLEALGLDLEGIAAAGVHKSFQRSFRCNWKVSVENSLECYHCASVHPGLRHTLDLARHLDVAFLDRGFVARVPTKAAPGSQTGRGDGEGMPAAVWAEAKSGKGLDFSQVHWIYPNQSITIWPGPGGSFTVNLWSPVSPTETSWWLGRWWRSEVAEEVREAQWSFITSVAEEDIVIVESVQEGIESGAWSFGRYQRSVPHHGEHMPHRFDRMVVDSLLA